jgi:hypothetical protein
MAKSTRRARRRKLKQLQTDQNTTTAAAVNKTSKKQSKAAQFRQEYAYVLKDLRRIFALAAVMFALLILLNLLLQ